MIIATTLLALALVAPAAAPATTASPSSRDPALSRAWDASPSHRCVVCGTDHATIEHSHLHRGQLVPVCADCSREFEAEPERFIAKLQPRSALFSDEYQERSPVSWVAFALGCWALLAIVCAATAAGVALRRGHPAGRHALLGLVGTIVGPLLALRLEPRRLPLGQHGFKQAATRAPTSCTHCEATNHPSANRCSRCDHALIPTAPSELASLTHNL